MRNLHFEALLKASVWKYRNVDTNWMSPSCLLLLFA